MRWWTDARLTRRQVVGGALALGVAACGRRAAPAVGRWAGRTVVVATMGGAARLALWQTVFVPFARETGCRVMEVSTYDPVPPLRQQVQSVTVQWDLVALDGSLAGIVAGDGLVELLDYGVLDRGAVTPWLARDESLSVFLDPLAIAYRGGALHDRLQVTWSDALDVGRLPGLRTLPRAAGGLLEGALLADGVAPEALYPLDIERAFGALDRVRDAVPRWWARPGEPGEMLALGEADLAVGRSGDLRAAIAGGAAARIAATPTPLLPTSWVIPFGAPNRDVAYDLIAYSLSPGVQDGLAARGYLAARAGAAPDALSGGAVATRVPGSPIALDLEWWAEHGWAARERFAGWLGQAHRRPDTRS